MADSFSKKENNKKKLEKAKEKALKREEKKTNNNKGKEVEFMYVDEFGQLTSVKPDNSEREEIDINDIQLGAAKIVDEGPQEITGVVDFVSDKGYGFIKENGSRENIFFHMNNAEEELKKGNKVSYEKEKSPKGFSAINIKIVK